MNKSNARRRPGEVADRRKIIAQHFSSQNRLQVHSRLALVVNRETKRFRKPEREEFSPWRVASSRDLANIGQKFVYLSDKVVNGWAAPPDGDPAAEAGGERFLNPNGLLNASYL